MSGFIILGVCLAVALSILGAVSVAYSALATATETLPNNTGSASDVKRIVTHDQYNETFTLDATTTPPVTLHAAFLATLSGGALTIDLRALTGTNGVSVDGNGLRVQVLRIKNLGANELTVSAGASNGLSIGAGLVIPAGGHVQMFLNDGISDIDATHKTIDLAGTGAQTSEWTIEMG